jgi:hypothetical protein
LAPTSDRAAQPQAQTQVFEKTQEDLDQNLIAPANGTFPIVWSVIYRATWRLRSPGAALAV